jgi:hypothetical protein
MYRRRSVWSDATALKAAPVSEPPLVTHLRVVGHADVVEHPTSRNPDVLESGRHLRRPASHRPLTDESVPLVVVSEAPGQRRNARLVEDADDDAHERGPPLVIADGDGHPGVLAAARVAPLRRQPREPVARTLGRTAAEGVVEEERPQAGDRGQADEAMLAVASHAVDENWMSDWLRQRVVFCEPY